MPDFTKYLPKQHKTLVNDPTEHALIAPAISFLTNYRFFKDDTFDTMTIQGEVKTSIPGEEVTLFYVFDGGIAFLANIVYFTFSDTFTAFDLLDKIEITELTNGAHRLDIHMLTQGGATGTLRETRVFVD